MCSTFVLHAAFTRFREDLRHCGLSFTRALRDLNARNLTLAISYSPHSGIALHSLPDPSSKPLTALIVYERPCDRSRLLRNVASLGIFVIEQTGDSPTEGQAYDLAIACVPNVETSVTLLRTVSKNGAVPTVAVIPGDHERKADWLPMDRVVSAIARDGDRSIDLAIRLALAGFGAADSTSAPVAPAMSASASANEPDGHGREPRLSPAERRVLALLVEANGQPVPQKALASTSSSKPSLSEAYLKTLIFRLRRKLATSLGDNAPTIAAVRGYGYVLRATPYAPSAPDTTAL